MPRAGAGRGRHQGRHRGLAARARGAVPERAGARHPGPRSHGRGRRPRVQGGRARIPEAARHEASAARDRDVHRRRRQQAGRRRLRRCRPAGAAAAWRRADAPCLGPHRRASRARRRDRLRARPARPWRLRMGRGRHLRVSRISPPMPRRSRATLRAAHAASVRSRSAPRSAASRRCSPTARRSAPGSGPLFAAIVLVDITPRVDQSGVAKIQGFMRERAAEGFATVAEAADAVAAYLPHRKRPRSHDGLKKNLRLHPDGRWRWHWDPRMLQGRALVRAGPSRCSKPR